MNLDVFRKPDPSGRMSKESFLIKNYLDEYNYIISFTITNNLIDIPFKQKVYLAINCILEVPMCKNTNCNNSVNFKNFNIGYLNYCSNKCVGSDPDIINAKTKKSLSKYGTKTPAESKVIKDKIIKTNNDRYGGNSPMSSKDVQNKSKKTLIENWGVDNPNRNSDIVKRRIESFKLSEYKATYKNTCMDRYGVDHHWKVKDIRLKSTDKMKISMNFKTRSLIEDKLLQYPTYKLLDIDYDIFKKSITIKCPNDHEFIINRETLYERYLNKSEICTICNPVCRGISGMEINLLNFIKENYDGEIVENSRKLISPYEIDIYLPKLKLGFEFNGLYWHSAVNKNMDYHKIKHSMCNDNNIELIAIWEDDWVFKNDLIKSFILNKLKKSNIKIYARKTCIKEISYNDSKIFLDNNHLQGDCKSSVRIGLFYDNKLVSLMTFSKLRLPLQRNLNKRKNEDYYELTRFCNVQNSNVLGGASKLLHYFIKNYSPNQIETYSDNTISSGDLYNKLGFEYTHTSRPGYSYLIDGKRSHRFNWRKQKLVSMGYDINKTEEQIMMELGYYRIYNAGNKKWVLSL